MDTVEQKIEHITTTLLRRKDKMSVKSYLVPLAVVGPSTEEQIVELIAGLEKLAYKVERQRSEEGFPGTGFLRLSWE